MKRLKPLIWADEPFSISGNCCGAPIALHTQKGNIMLEVNDLTILSNTRTVVNKVSLAVSSGQIVALLGPNGAGKSELVLGIAGVMQLSSGTVSVNNIEIQNLSVQGIRASGVATVPEGHQVLSNLSVIDNLWVAGAGLSKSDCETEVGRVFEVFPELVALKQQAAGSLSGGQQQMVALAQAVVSKPSFLLIDEMSLGLAPVVIDRLINVISDLRDRGMGILLIEQFTQLALDMADYCYVLSQGETKFQGLPETLKADKSILEQAYLGG